MRHDPEVPLGSSNSKELWQLLAPVLNRLQRSGAIRRPGVADVRRIALALSATARWDRDLLIGVLRTLLVTDPEHERIFDRELAELSIERRVRACRPSWPKRSMRARREAASDTSREPDDVQRSDTFTNPGRSSKSRTWWYWLTAIALGLLVAIALEQWLPEPGTNDHPTSPPIGLDQPQEPPPPGWRHIDTWQSLRRKVAGGLRPAFEAMAGWTDGHARAIAITGATFGALIWWFGTPRRRTRPSAPVSDGTPFDPKTIGGRNPPWLRKHDLDRVAPAIPYRESTATHDLDLKRTVLATCQRGGVLTPVHRRAMRLTPVELWIDLRAPSLGWHTAAFDLLRGLGARGIDIRAVTLPESTHLANALLGRIERARDAHRALCLVVAEPADLNPKDARRIANAMPSLVWLDLRAPGGWRDSTMLHREGIRVERATVDGLIRALGSPGVNTGNDHRPGLGAPYRHVESKEIERRLGAALPWAQLAAKLPPPVSLGLLEALREKHFDSLPRTFVARLVELPGATLTSQGLVFPLSLRTRLRAGFARHRSTSTQHEELECLLEILDDARPTDESTACFRDWQWRRSRVRLDLEPDQAIHALSRLERTVLGPAIRADLAFTVVPPSRFARLLRRFGLASGLPSDDSPRVSLLRRPRYKASLRRLRILSPESIGRAKSFCGWDTIAFVIFAVIFSILFQIRWHDVRTIRTPVPGIAPNVETPDLSLPTHAPGPEEPPPDNNDPVSSGPATLQPGTQPAVSANVDTPPPSTPTEPQQPPPPSTPPPSQAPPDIILPWPPTEVAITAGGRLELSDRPTAISFALSGPLVAVATGRSVTVLDSVTNRQVLALPTGWKVASVAFSGTGRVAAAGTNGRVATWDSATWEPRDRLELVGGDDIRKVRYAPDGESLAILDARGRISRWIPKSGEATTLHQLRSSVGDLAFLPRGRHLVAASREGDLVSIDWRATPDADRGARRDRIEVTQVDAIGYLGEGGLIAFGGRSGTLYEVAVGNDGSLGTPREVVRTRRWISDIATLPGTAGTRLIATAHQDGGLRLHRRDADGTWHSLSPTNAPTIEHGRTMYALALAADGRSVVTVGSDRTIRTWRLEAAPGGWSGTP